ncbi:MAG: hypothetical protein AAF500_17530 [Myxococcota bacterium]
MAKEDIQAELAALRAQVAALVAARAPADTAAATETSEAPTTTVAIANASHEGVMGHVEELVELLEHEVKESPVIAGVAVFALGVLVGRLLR